VYEVIVFVQNLFVIVGFDLMAQKGLIEFIIHYLLYLEL
jgi:hypothetical protein